MDFWQIVMAAATQGGGSAPFVGPGPELVTNGDFAGGATGWTVSNFSGGSSITGGAMVFNDGADDGDTLSQNLGTLVIGATYRVVYSVTARTSGAISFLLAGVTGTTRNTVDTFSQDIVAVSTSGVLTLGSGAPVLTIDDISVTRIA